MSAFQSSHNDLAVNGFVSVFDGLLSAVSGKATHRLAPRIQEIEKKLEKEEVLSWKEIVFFPTLLSFLLVTIKSMTCRNSTCLKHVRVAIETIFCQQQSCLVACWKPCFDRIDHTGSLAVHRSAESSD